MSEEKTVRTETPALIVERPRRVLGARDERRRNRRFNLAQRIRVRPAGLDGPEFDDQQVTVNISRDGLYFLTRENNYRLGMKVMVTWPYDPTSGGVNLDYLGRVVRIVELPEGKRGVAIHLFLQMNFKH
jgi:hypothetical protein